MTPLELKTFKGNDILVSCLLNIVFDAWYVSREIERAHNGAILFVKSHSTFSYP
jgi:hypothetical protein